MLKIQSSQHGHWPEIGAKFNWHFVFCDFL